MILSHPNAIVWFYSSCFQRQCSIVFQNSEISKDEDEEQLAYLRNEVLPKAKAIVIGPGLSTDTLAKKLLDMVLEWNRSQNCPIVIDADA